MLHRESPPTSLSNSLEEPRTCSVWQMGAHRKQYTFSSPHALRPKATPTHQSPHLLLLTTTGEIMFSLFFKEMRFKILTQQYPWETFKTLFWEFWKGGEKEVQNTYGNWKTPSPTRDVSLRQVSSRPPARPRTCLKGSFSGPTPAPLNQKLPAGAQPSTL